MRIFGHSWYAVLAATLAIYAVGALLYGVLFSAQWAEWSGLTPEAIQGEGMARMPFSIVMPALLALGLAWILQTRECHWTSGAATGAIVGLFFLVSTTMYGWVYGLERTEVFALDSVHFMLDGIVGGAVLGLFPRPKG